MVRAIPFSNKSIPGIFFFTFEYLVIHTQESSNKVTFLVTCKYGHPDGGVGGDNWSNSEEGRVLLRRCRDAY